MQFHDEDEKALIETFRRNGGERKFLFRNVGKGGDVMQASKRETRALARLLRSGHIERYFNSGSWVYYRLKERQPDKNETTGGDV